MQRNPPKIRYVERKDPSGEAWIARVRVSKTGRTIYFGTKALQRGQGIRGNHFDVETGDEYWVSGVKRDGRDRHWAEGGEVLIERSAVPIYLEATGRAGLPQRMRVVDDLPIAPEVTESESRTTGQVAAGKAHSGNQK